MRGIREVFVLAFLHVETRRVILSPATFHPNEAWVAAQAESIVEQARKQGLRVRYVQRDRDGKYAGFDEVLKRKRVKALKGAVRAPNTRAFVERFIGSVRRESLRHFLVFGTQHLDSVLKTWLDFYHRHRPHQGKDNELLTGQSRITNSESVAIAETISLRDVRYEEQLGGLLKSYRRKAA